MTKPQSAEPILGDYYRDGEIGSTAQMAENRIIQVEALAKLLYGEPGEAFRIMNPNIQDTVCWLLGDLIGEYRLLMHKADQETKEGRV